MSDSVWSDFHRRWSRLTPPLRANDEVTAALGRAIVGGDELALLLGVTPELAAIARHTIAVDWSADMVAHIWPGDGPARRAVLGNWLALPHLRERFTAVIGDGSLNVLAYADYPRLFAELAGVLRPGARVAVRVYETPTPSQSLDEARQDALAGQGGGFHAFKWRLAMALAAARGDADVPVREIHRAFTAAFPDRAALAAASGWSVETISEIDAYAGSATIYSFPTRAQIEAALPTSFSAARFLVSGTYELAERCPILVADFAP